MNDKITIIRADGMTVQGDIICYLQNKDTHAKYEYYTLNEIVGTGAESTVKIYVSKMKQGNPVLDTPITEEEWNVLKGYMGSALKGEVNNSIEYLPLGGENVSVSDRAIGMPTSYDYINKQRGIYAQAMASMETTAAVNPEPTVEPAPVAEPQSEPVIETAPQNEPAPIPSTPVETPSIEPVPISNPMLDANVQVGPTQNPADVTISQDEINAPLNQSEMQTEPAAPIEPAPVSFQAEPVEKAVPFNEPAMDTADNEPLVEETNETSTMTSINIDEIARKYDEMIKDLEALKNKEIEAAQRYNDTIKLSAMHNEQHANYVANEQMKETPVESASNNMFDNPTPAQSPIIEPTPVTPVVPEPIMQTATPASDEIETNWFDMKIA